MGDDRTFLPKGTTLTCENGHAICDLSEEVSEGQEVSDVAENWREGQRHTPGELVRGCAVCGAHWYFLSMMGGWMHTERGWWPRELPDGARQVMDEQ